MAELIAGELVKELISQLVSVSKKAFKCKDIAGNLASMIGDVEPNINEILLRGRELSPYQQVQLRRFSETLVEGKKLAEQILKCNSWNLVRQLYDLKKMEDLEKKISSFLGGVLVTHVLVRVHNLWEFCEARFDRTDKNFERLGEQLGFTKIRGSGLLRETMNTGDARTEMVTSGDFRNLGVTSFKEIEEHWVGSELGKMKVKEMLFSLKDEGRLIGISGMGGSGKTALARKLERDEEVRGHFQNQILFLIVSMSPNLEDLRARICGFLTDFKAAPGATLPEPIVQTRKLLILDDVWTKRTLDQLMFKMPSCTTLVVSRFKFTDPKATYDVELLNEDEGTSLFCLSAFGQDSIPSGFNINLVKQVVEECNGLPLTLKVIGTSLKDKPDIHWEGAVSLSKGRVFAQTKATVETLDLKTRECLLDVLAFPEGEKIDAHVIINMWIKLHDLKMETAVRILVNLSDKKNLLILAKDPRLGALRTGYYGPFVMQHPLVRDITLRISRCGTVNRRERLLMSKREPKLPREWERNNNEPYDARIVSINTGEMTEMDWFDMELPKAKVLKINFFSDKYVLPPFIAKMGRLRTLIIINNGMSFAHLHDFSSFTNFAKLSSLWLEMVHVPKLSKRTVPFKKLRKLSLINCKINNSFDHTASDMAKIFPNLADLLIDHCDDLVLLPSTICGISSLKSISIINCPRFKELPKNLSKLKALRRLRLYACPELESLPVEICELPSLKYLDISQCVSLNSLPEKIGKLSRLEKIDMRECSLPTIPSSAVSLTSLRKVICDKEKLCMWEEVKKAVPELCVVAA